MADRRRWSVKLQIHTELMQTCWPLKKEGVQITQDDIWNETDQIIETMDNEELEYYSDLVNKIKEESFQNEGEIRREIVRARCSPSAVTLTLERMSPEQKLAVEEMGFGNVLQLKLKEFSRGEVAEAVDCFNPTNMKFLVEGGVDEVELTAATVGKMLGFDEDSRQQPVPDKLKRSTELGLEQSEWSINKLRNYICEHQHSATSPEWRQRVLLYLLAVFYAPTPRWNPTRELAVASTTFREPRIYAWSEYVLEHLKKWVSCYKAAKDKKLLKERHLGGRLYVLMLLLRVEKRKLISSTQEVNNQKRKVKSVVKNQAICYQQIFMDGKEHAEYNEAYADKFAWEGKVGYDVNMMHQILIPILNKDHWWVVACDLKSGICTLLDSLGKTEGTPDRIKYKHELIHLAQLWLLSEGRTVN